MEMGSSQWLTSLQHEGTGNPTQHTAEHLGIHIIEDRLVFDALTSGVDPQLWSHNLTSGLTQILSTDILALGDWAGGIVHGQKVWFDCVVRESLTKFVQVTVLNLVLQLRRICDGNCEFEHSDLCIISRAPVFHRFRTNQWNRNWLLPLVYRKWGR